MKKVTAIFLFLILSMSILSGCGKEKKDALVVGFDDTFVPMGFKNESGEIVGFDVDLAKEVSKRIGRELKFQSIDWSMKESELNSGNIDLIWNGYSITEERKEKLTFTKGYLANRQIIITLASSSINKKSDLKGKKIAVQNESSSLEAISKDEDFIKSIQGGKPYLFDTNNEALMDLEAGRVDAVVADEILARYYIKERGEGKYKILEEDFGKEEYGIGLRKSDKDLAEKINKALEDIKKDGTGKAISEKWFGEDILK